jgi:hypothetical protein
VRLRHHYRPPEIRRGLLLALVLALTAGFVVARSRHSHRARGPATAPTRSSGSWAPAGTPPLPDARAAALVSHRLENRLANLPFNSYVPTNAQLAAFHAARDPHGQLADDDVPQRRYVTGRPGLINPSTDDLIQWAARKWGIPADWMRAVMIVESQWDQTDVGDRATVSPAWYSQYPSQARIQGSYDVFESMGIAQVKWRPNGSVGAGTEPLRWESTAFSLDFYGAEIRFFFDGDCSWCGPGYAPRQRWNSIGAWYEPHPWGNPGQEAYVTEIQHALAARAWAHPGS